MVISSDKKSVTFVWKDFTNDATITVKAIPSLNTITIGDVSDVFVSLSINGKSMVVTGDSITARTESELKVEGVLIYGYTNGSATTTNGDYVKAESTTNTYNRNDGYYKFETTLAGFNEDFEVSFTSTEREYNFKAMVMEGMEEYGRITSDEIQTVKFGDTLTVMQETKVHNYRFDEWIINDQTWSKDTTLTIQLTESVKALLESVDLGENIEIYATYVRSTTEITVEVEGKGDVKITQESENIEYLIESGHKAKNLEIFLVQDMIVTLLPNDGYELDVAYIDGEVVDVTDYGYTENSKTLAIYMTFDNPVQSLKFVYKASVAIVTVQSGTLINYIKTLGNTVGGTIYLTDSEGNKLDETLYLPNGKKDDGSDNYIYGGSYKISTFTDETLYFIIEVKSGFEITTEATSGIISNEYDINGVHVYSFSGVKDGNEIDALFTARTNTINVYFALEGDNESQHAGLIAVDTTSSLVVATPYRGDNISAYVVTGTNFYVDIYSSLAYSLLADENGLIKYEIFYDANDEVLEGEIHAGAVQAHDEERKLDTGYTYASTFEITYVNTNLTLVIYVSAKEYSVRLNYDNEYFITLPEKVIYGQRWSVDSLSDEDRELLFADKEGYTLMGYYTKPNGQGTKYLTENGATTTRWYENGYVYNNVRYEESTGYDSENDEITLYAYFVYNRAKIVMSFKPNGVANLEDVSISKVITNLSDLLAYVDQNNRWYAEIRLGQTINVETISIDGFEFTNWILSYGDNEIIKTSSFVYEINESETYILTAEYNPSYSIKVINYNNAKNDGGTSVLMQDGGIVGKSTFDPSKSVTLQAKANEGYRFLYWLDEEGERIYAQSVVNGVATYTYPELVEDQINLTAVFIGKTINVSLDIQEILNRHTVASIKVNNKTIDYTKNIVAYVGDTFTVEIIKSIGFGVTVEGLEFDLDASGNLVYSHIFDYNELEVVDDDTYSASITFHATREEIKLTFKQYLENAVDDDEIEKTGTNVVTKNDGTVLIILNGDSTTVEYGLEFTINFKVNDNYEIARIVLVSDGLGHDITKLVGDNGKIVFNKSLVDDYFDYNMIFEVEYNRLVWTDESVISSYLVGAGTKDNPFLIYTPNDFGFVAYLINNNITYNDVDMSRACYKVHEDIDFSGRYWEPIGTKENPFNGTLNIGKATIKNIVLYKTYTNPSTSYGGLIWVIGSDGLVQITNNTLLVALLSVGGGAIVVGGAVAFVHVQRLRKRKRLNDIANS
jgi:hypothetical protein